jgi:putative transposase
VVNYRRNFHPGGTYFFTVALRNRNATLLTDHVSLLRNAFHAVKLATPFTIDAIVVLPDHLHAIWTLPEGDADYPARWRAIKSAFVRSLKREGIQAQRNARGEATIWQRRYWEHTIRDDHDWQCHVDYIHFNPVKHGYVASPVDWVHSSIHAFIARGVILRDWGGSGIETAGRFGE